MAEFIPFSGVFYDPERIGRIDDVVAPPYDVISEKGQTILYERHPKNVIRLILGKQLDGDNAQNSVHTRAARFFQDWIAEKTLIRDPEPGFYLTSVSFTINEQTFKRYGVIGLVRLEPFSKGIVLPHERTFSKVKSERLQLMKACHANFSPIFGLYQDANGTLPRLREAVKSLEPDLFLTDDNGFSHCLWRITDPSTIAFVSQSLADQRIYIADGHHRYETALNYREWVREKEQDAFSQDHPANFVMMNLISMADPGLVILPAHRLLKEVPEDKLGGFIDSATAYFSVNRFSLEDSPDGAVTAFSDFMMKSSHTNTVGVYRKNDPFLYALTLKQGVMERLFDKEEPVCLLALDVTVLTRLIMMDLLGFDQNRLDDDKKILYQTQTADAVDDVKNGLADVAFILNPTKISQVQRVSEAGHIMPRKSTYFFPKVISGLVFNLLK